MVFFSSMVSKTFNIDFLKKEILYYTLFIVDNTNFSSQTNYLIFKSKYSRLNLVCNTKSVNLKLKISKFKFKKMNNQGLINGFYRAV
jgi:hypothetical protein